ncbi:hypothetical protein SAMN04487900_1373 [Prevotella communis]|uniref:Uncharacterized protein n=1 Tax=Prevotella communis TaxID=2913614 RepID=A0A1H0KZY2_9BACT|nr:hypothetical protein SAMN04487900_1373 [Prevotella communis]
MPTPNGVNSYFSPCSSYTKFGDFLEQESKSGYSSYMSYFSYLFLQPIGIRF